MREGLEDALVALFESQAQARYDFCGEQRAWHLPRLDQAAAALIQLFPREAAAAMRRAHDPYGNSLL